MVNEASFAHRPGSPCPPAAAPVRTPRPAAARPGEAGA